MNSAYRVYELEPDTLSVINHHTYILDIEKANARGNGTYELEYSAKVYSQWFIFPFLYDLGFYWEKKPIYPTRKI